MQMLLLYALVACSAVLLRYMLGLSSACLYVGKAISDTKSKTGFQDAITPPISTNIAIINWLAAVCLLGYIFWQDGIVSGGVALIGFVIVATIAGATIIPKSDSEHFLRMIYNSLANRVANYTKSNDHMRADAAAELVSRIEATFGNRLT